MTAAKETTVPWEELPAPGGARALRIAADAKGTVYVETDDGLHASPDEGASWARVAGPGARVLVSPRGEARIFEPPATPSGPPVERGCRTTTASGIDHAGALWAAIETADLSFYPTDVGRGPPILQPATVITRAIRRSIDGGATWTTVHDSLGARAFAFDETGRTWIAGNAGVHVSEDAGATWRRVSERPGTSLAVAGARIVLGTSMHASISQDAGATFAPIAGRFRERGPWGSLEGEALDFRILARAPEGAIWAGAAGLGGGVFRLGETGTRWDSVNFGLTVIPRVGSRQGVIRPTALAFTPAGTSFVTTEGHGLFRLRRASH